MLGHLGGILQSGSPPGPQHPDGLWQTWNSDQVQITFGSHLQREMLHRPCSCGRTQPSRAQQRAHHHSGWCSCEPQPGSLLSPMQQRAPGVTTAQLCSAVGTSCSPSLVTSDVTCRSAPQGRGYASHLDAVGKWKARKSSDAAPAAAGPSSSGQPPAGVRVASFFQLSIEPGSRGSKGCVCQKPAARPSMLSIP